MDRRLTLCSPARSYSRCFLQGGVRPSSGGRSLIVGDGLEPLPPLLQEAAGEMVSAIGRLDADLLLFLNTANIVPEALLERLDAAA